jgi:serine/threonine protein kinase
MQSVRMTSAGAGGWQPPTVEEAARLFPQYEVLSLLGRGGMGAVYKARQIELDRLVAIKLLPLEVSVDRDFADRFRREARAMAKLHHPNIISVHEFGTTSEGHLFFAMEFIEGANLHQMIHGPGLSPAQALEIIGGVCDALAYEHGKGVVHRDIKPANVMVSVEGEVKVADFGLARLSDPAAEQFGHTSTGMVMGTPDYMAPEQKRGMNVDHRADIYSPGGDALRDALPRSAAGHLRPAERARGRRGCARRSSGDQGDAAAARPAISIDAGDEDRRVRREHAIGRAACASGGKRSTAETRGDESGAFAWFKEIQGAAFRGNWRGHRRRSRDPLG